MIRRTFLMSAAAALAATVPAFGADAMGDPASFVRDVANEVLDVIRKDPELLKANPEKIRQLIDSRIAPVTDLRKMTRMAVGRKWREASEAQRSELVTQFRETLTRVYSGAFSSVRDHRVELKPARGASGDDVVVRTQVVSSASEPIAIDYRVYKTDGGWKIYDVNVEGIWLVANYRSQFAEVLNASGIDGLIAQMKSRNSAAAASK